MKLSRLITQLRNYSLLFNYSLIFKILKIKMESRTVRKMHARALAESATTQLKFMDVTSILWTIIRNIEQ